MSPHKARQHIAGGIITGGFIAAASLTAVISFSPNQIEFREARLAASPLLIDFGSFAPLAAGPSFQEASDGTSCGVKRQSSASDIENDVCFIDLNKPLTLAAKP